MAIKGVPWVDFVLWAEAKADNILIERIRFDEQFNLFCLYIYDVKVN